VVITREEKPFGIFTERDLVTEFLAKGAAIDSEVGKAASSPLATIASGASVHLAAVNMTMKHIKRLPVTALDKIVGIITARDLVEAYAK
jgi:signal-transduction protein with cAMP-binding, CBS, and nucleotidyltransferase domain